MNEPPTPRTPFVIGCPRSGTTWAQLLLDRDPEVDAAPETHILSFYLVRVRRQMHEAILRVREIIDWQLQRLARPIGPGLQGLRRR